MKEMDRSTFMKLAGAGSAAAAIPFVGKLAESRVEHGVLRFRAAGGVPKEPLPSYATHLVEGTVDLGAGTGLVTSRVVAGHPGEPSLIGLPGLSRVISITNVEPDGQRYRLQGVIEDRSQLQRGESPMVEILVDRARKLVHVPFLGHPSALPLA